MKTKNYLWGVLAMATLSLAACSSEESENIIKHPEGTPATLELTLTGTPANTKATGTLPSDDDNGEKKIVRVAVAIFDANGKALTVQETTYNNSKLTINCVPGRNPCTGIVVANAPAGTFANVKTKTDFIAKTVPLTQTHTELPMSGDIKENSSTSFSLTAGSTQALTAELSRLVARVSVKSIKTDFASNGQYAAATFKLKEVFLHNGNTLSTVAPAAPAVSAAKTGWNTTPPQANYLAGFNDALPAAVTMAGASQPHTTNYWFYTFANSSTATPTKLVIYGEFDEDGMGQSAAQDVFYPVVVNKAQPGTSITGGGSGDATIAPNSTYAISATIKGKGAPDPDTDINPAVLDLTVTVASWALTITQEVTFD